MIEQSLYFALGFLVAGLVSLAVLPAFWRRAYRLSRREIEATLPLSPSEISAERDQLRAKFAVERVQFEQKVEAAAAERQKVMVIAGEKAVIIARMDEDLTARRQDIEALGKRAAFLDEELARSQSSLGEAQSALATTRANLAQLEQEHRALDLNRLEIQDSADQRRVEIAAQRMNLEAQKARIEEVDGALKAARADARARAEELREMARVLRERETELAITQSRLASAEEIGDKRVQIIVERDAIVDQLREKTAGLAKAAKQAEAALRQEARRAAQAEKLAAEREEAAQRLRDEGRETASDLSKSIAKLRAEKQKLQADLAEARARASQLQRDLSAARREGPAVADLRRKAAPAD